MKKQTNNLPEHCRECRYWARNHAEGWDTCDLYDVTGQHRDCLPESCVWFKPKDPEELRERQKPRLRTTKPRRKKQKAVELEAKMLKLYNEGLNDRQISEKVGCTESGVWHWRRRTGLPSQTERTKAQEKTGGK